MFIVTMFYTIRNFVFVIVIACVSSSTIRVNDQLEEINFNFTQFATKYGHPAEVHEVLTEDGYKLTLFHIPGKRNDDPIFIMHGLADSADEFILRGDMSLAITLAEKGYDLWFGNARGNNYCRKHLKYTDKDKRFWDFSFHEIATYDLPAYIDYILNATGASQLAAIGHSQGNTVFYVLGATKPEYNKKIKVLVALAPVCYLHSLKPPISLLMRTAPILNRWLVLIGEEEIFGNHTESRVLLESACTKSTYQFCEDIFFILMGYDPEDLELEFFPIVAGHYPSRMSRKTLMHTIQIALEKRFSQFNYGAERNIVEYNSTDSPAYDLSKVTMPVAMYAGKNDGLAALKDVRLLKKQLPNVVQFVVMEREEHNHVAFVYGKSMKKYLYPRIFKLLEKYSRRTQSKL